MTSEELVSLYASCKLCPRNCGVNRLAGAQGFCGETADLTLATASIHFGEEPPITGKGGSGTLFFSGCTLRCSFCQNHQISHHGMGAPIDAALFSKICLTLQERKAENINLVTGSHAIPAIVIALRQARKDGLTIPILWNSSAYEKVSSINYLADTVSVWLPDLKTLDPDIASRYFKAPDYPEQATQSILRMAELNTLHYGYGRAGKQDKVLTSGVIVRHLVLPDRLESTRAVLKWFSRHLSGKALLSLMLQYTPVKTGLMLPSERFICEDESEKVLSLLEEFDIDDGFFQELVPSSDWLPDFELTNPFSSGLSKPVWHWKTGFIGETNV